MTREELLSVAKPILFNTDMVRAIPDGRKTVTRRVIKKKLIENKFNFVYQSQNIHLWDGKEKIKAPYNPGDILYVRETWTLEEFYDDEALIRFRAGGEIGIDYECEGDTYSKLLKYADSKWIPSLFMPKEAARIFLKVKDVRVERLQCIDGKQVLAEGVDNGKSNPSMVVRWEIMQRMVFEKVWNSTIKKSDLSKYGWSANPWVWVIEFERIEPVKE